MRVDGSQRAFNPGLLREPILIESPIIALAADGGTSTAANGTAVHSCWASFHGLWGKEFDAVRQRHSETLHGVTIRYLDGITSKMRVVRGTKRLDIIEVLDVNGTRELLTLACKEID